MAKCPSWCFQNSIMQRRMRLTGTLRWSRGDTERAADWNSATRTKLSGFRSILYANRFMNLRLAQLLKHEELCRGGGTTKRAEEGPVWNNISSISLKLADNFGIRFPRSAIGTGPRYDAICFGITSLNNISGGRESTYVEFLRKERIQMNIYSSCVPRTRTNRGKDQNHFVCYQYFLK